MATDCLRDILRNTRSATRLTVPAVIISIAIFAVNATFANNSKPATSPTKLQTKTEFETAGVLNQSVPENGSIHQWKTVHMRVTAYCPCSKCCGRFSDGLTACGHRIAAGDVFVAAAQEYPFGTEILIPGYANELPVKVLDRGGAIYGERLDVFFDSHQKALEWGVRYLDVKVGYK